MGGSGEGAGGWVGGKCERRALFLRQVRNANTTNCTTLTRTTAPCIDGEIPWASDGFLAQHGPTIPLVHSKQTRAGGGACRCWGSGVRNDEWPSFEGPLGKT